MSHAAIAAVLAMVEATVGERLAAFSLASFASREQRAWPSTPVAAARAGLSRSQYLAARDGLARRGLVIVEAPGGGRGRAPIISLAASRAARACQRPRRRPAGGAVLVGPASRSRRISASVIAPVW